MKINGEPPESLKSLFTARANPWAPKYEQELWNDRSMGQYNAAVARHKGMLECVAGVLRYNALDTAHIAHMLTHHTDSFIKNIANATEQEVRTMRLDMMQFYNSTMFSTNCYAYALNIRKGFQPGSKLTPGQLECMNENPTVVLHGQLKLLFDGLVRDGIDWFKGNPNKDKAPDGYYLAALVTKQNQMTGLMDDFHFVRYDRDGSCSHKTGHSYVTNLDHKGQIITDPTTQEIMPGYEYEGCLMVPAVLPRYKCA